MQKALMVFSSSPKLIIVKADEQFDDYVSNFTYTQKIQNKKKDRTRSLNIIAILTKNTDRKQIFCH